MNFPLVAAALCFLIGFYPEAGFSVWKSPPEAFNPSDLSIESIDLASDPMGNAITVIASDEVEATYFSAATGTYSPGVVLYNDIADQVHVDMDASGTALVIWFEYTNFAIRTAYFNGSSWVTPSPDPLQLVSTDSGTAIAMDGSGNGLGLWINGTDVNSSFFTGGNWSAPATIGTGTDSVQAAFSANGTAAAAWVNAGAVTVANYIGGVWQVPVVLGSVLDKSVELAMDASGHGLVSWIDSLTGDVRYSYFNGAAWSVAQNISFAPGNLEVALDMSPGGSAVAIWIDSALNGRSSTFNGTSWTPPVLFTTGIPAPFSTFPPIASSLDVSLDSFGNALAVWQTTDLQIKSALMPAGTSVFGPSELVSNLFSSPDPVGIYTVVAALSDNGRGFTSWIELFNGEQFEAFGSYTLFSGRIEGSVCQNKFAWQTDRIHIIGWTPFGDPSVLAYYLRRNGVIIAVIPPTGPFIYFDHNRSKNEPDVYALTALRAIGESDPLIVVLR